MGAPPSRAYLTINCRQASLTLSSGSLSGGINGTGTFETVSGTTDTLTNVTIYSGTTFTTTSGATTDILGRHRQQGNVRHRRHVGQRDRQSRQQRHAVGRRHGHHEDQQRQRAFLRGSGVTLTNTNNTIQGAGLIGDNGALTIVNQATIDANASGQSLNLSQGGGVVTNTGTLEATDGGTLNLFSKVTNTGGAITANGGTVNVDDATIVGGTLNTTGGDLMQTVGSSDLNGVTISTGSHLHDCGRRDDAAGYLPRQRGDVPHRRLGGQRDRQSRQQRHAVGRRHGHHEVRAPAAARSCAATA